MTNSRKILIVDDDAELREALVEQLALHEEFESIAVDSGSKGVQAAKAIAFARDLPFVGVNHLEGHLLSARLDADVPFPYVGLLVSGGHTSLYYAEDLGRYRRLDGASRRPAIQRGRHRAPGWQLRIRAPLR